MLKSCDKALAGGNFLEARIICPRLSGKSRVAAIDWLQEKARTGCGQRGADAHELIKIGAHQRPYFC